MREDPVRIRILWWSVGGGLIGTTCGMVLYAVSVFGSEFAWAGMTLLSAVFSYPAGLWVFDLVTDPAYRGPDPGLALLVIGPAVNGAVVGALVGSLLWLVGRYGADSDRGADA